MKTFPFIIFSLILLLAAAACSDSCSENKNALPRAGFYAAGTNDTKITIDSLEIVGVGIPGDSVLSPASASINEVYLPFRIDSDTTSYVFIDSHALGGARDTVVFVYSRTPRFVNVECGVSYVFDIKKISSQGVLIDSVTCPQGYIDNANRENLHIYFDVILDTE